MKPLNDYIFIELDKKEKLAESTSGILIPTDSIAREGAVLGTVIELGPGVEGVIVGMRVMFNENQFDHLFVNQETKQDVVVGKIAGIYAYAE